MRTPPWLGLVPAVLLLWTGFSALPASLAAWKGHRQSLGALLEAVAHEGVKEHRFLRLVARALEPGDHLVLVRDLDRLLREPRLSMDPWVPLLAEGWKGPTEILWDRVPAQAAAVLSHWIPRIPRDEAELTSRATVVVAWGSQWTPEEALGETRLLWEAGPLHRVWRKAR